MEGWLAESHYAEQLKANGTNFSTPAPCPADYGEGKSYWIETYPIDLGDECRTGPVPDEADVVVIGTGITAAGVLYNLAEKRPDLRIAVVEARGICSGATGRNGGHICRAEGRALRSHVKLTGRDEALRLAKLGTRNRDLMLDAIDKLGIRDKIDLRLTGTRVVFASEEERDEQRAEVEFAKTLGITLEGRYLDAEQLAQESNFALERCPFGGDCIDKSGTVFPRKLVAEILHNAKKRVPGLTIHSHNPAKSVTRHETASGPSYLVTTDRGTIRSRAVVHATNAYVSQLIPSLAGQAGVLGCKAECIAVVPNVPNACSGAPTGLRGGLGFEEFWHYLIQRPDNGPFIYGWAGIEQVGEYDDSVAIPLEASGKPPGCDLMTEFLEKGFPHSFRDIDLGRDVSHRWTGIQGFTNTGASLVGRWSKESPGEFISVGHNGEGMGRCFACATVMTDRLLHYLDGNEDDKWAAPEWFPKSFLYNI
ncbi:FAD dependent oxidoreductase [Diaporthe sp. PMI_573]|nr:FAD dependent oxidoreductase [Diaporthaceae sp. PMI_573]